MRRPLIVAALLLAAPLAMAQVYKWTDASGTVHYSEAPPAQGTNYSKVKTTGTVEPIQAPPSSETPGQSETKPAEPPVPMADTPENRGRLCESLKTNLAALQGAGPVVMQENGTTTAINDAQRKQQLATAQAQYDQFCQGK